MFSSLWIDEPEPEVREEGWLGDALRNLIDRGYAIVRGAVPHDAIDRYLTQYDGIVGERSGLQVIQPYTSAPVAIEDGDPYVPGAKVLDTYRFLPAATELMFAEKLDAVLHAVFRDGALAFQGLHFEVGSTQTIHQDTAYVVIDDRPLNLIASWIALEDVTPGSGELVYYPGSHRWPHFLYGGVHKHQHGHGDVEHGRHLRSLTERAAAEGVARAAFLPKKGDALFWHADLAHGGGEITRPGVTRRSLVTHYCPLSNAPHFFNYNRFAPVPRGPDATISMYYDADRPAPGAPVREDARDRIARIAGERREDRDGAETVRSLGSAIRRFPAVALAGDSHSWMFGGTGFLGETLMLHQPCMAASARGLANPKARGGHGPRVLRFLKTVREIASPTTPALLQFGQVDIEFVYNFRRLQSGETAFDAADFDAFAEQTVHRYLAWASNVLTKVWPRGRLAVLGVAPPTLADAGLADGYANAHIADLQEHFDIDAVRQGLARLQFPDLPARTALHRAFNARLADACLEAGLFYVDAFDAFLGPDGVVAPAFQTGDHHIDPLSPATRDIAAGVLDRVLAA